MAEAVKYLFDRAFESTSKGSATSVASTAQKMQEEWERKMADACVTAYEEGRAEGEAEAQKSIELETREQVKALLKCAEQLLESVKQECDDIRSEAIQLANTTATLLARNLIERMPVASLEGIFSEALERAADAPHIALSVNDNLVDAVQEIITSIAAEKGFSGKIIVLGDPKVNSGDCCLQWADGGLSVDFEKTKNEISQIVNRHLETSAPQPSASNSNVPELPESEMKNLSETENTSEPTSGSGEMQ